MRWLPGSASRFEGSDPLREGFGHRDSDEIPGPASESSCLEGMPCISRRVMVCAEVRTETDGLASTQIASKGNPK